MTRGVVDLGYNLISADNVIIKPADATSYFIIFSWNSETSSVICSQLKCIDFLTVRNSDCSLEDLEGLLSIASNLVV